LRIPKGTKLVLEIWHFAQVLEDCAIVTKAETAWWGHSIPFGLLVLGLGGV